TGRPPAARPDHRGWPPPRPRSRPAPGTAPRPGRRPRPAVPSAAAGRARGTPPRWRRRWAPRWRTRSSDAASTAASTPPARRRGARSNARATSRCEVNRSGPRLAYRTRIRWTTGACPPGGWFLVMTASSDRGERQQLTAGRSDLYLGVHAGADTAVEAGGPPA